MSDTQTLATLIGFGILVVLAGAWFLWFANKSWNVNIARLEQPDWAGLAQALGGVHIPKVLKTLYEDRALVQKRDFAILDETYIERRSLENLSFENLSIETPNTKQAKKKRKYPEIKLWPIGFFFPAHPASLKHPGVSLLPKGSFAFAHDTYHTYFVILSETPSDDLPVHLYFDNDTYGATEEIISSSLKTFLSLKRRRIEHGPNKNVTTVDLN